ncbi:MAG: hypothetical protein IJH87_04365 [Atopobiaceae bacterium]|nr:hypothetical protein [Atopobiaceae bacterium]
MLDRRSFLKMLAATTADAPVLTLGLTGCEGSGATGDMETITIGMTADIDSMDPAKAESAATRELLFNVYEGLVKPDTEGNLNPTVAADFSVSPEGDIYSFVLREGVKFHDGSTVTAEDVKYSIERYRDSTTGGSLVSAFKKVDHVDIVDDTHVDVFLTEPNTDFLAYFTIGITPKAVEDLDANPVGVGPYKFASRSPLENVVLEKFDEYWDEEHAAHIPNVIFKITSNTDSIGMELAGGSLDLFYRTPEAQLDQLDPADFTIYEGGMNLVQALYLNNAVKPFDDMRVRQALCYAIDKQEIMDYVSGGKGAEVGSSMYPAFAKYFMPELNDVYTQDLDKARDLLKQAGYEDGFSFTVRVSSSHPQHIETCEVLKEQLAKISVTMSIQEIEWNSWLSDVYNGRQHEATVVGVDASALNAPSMLSRFVSTAGNNFINFSSANYDETYARAAASIDDDEKTELYKECERILAEEAASVYIQDLPSFVALHKRFTGYEFYPLYAQNIASIRPAE